MIYDFTVKSISTGTDGYTNGAFQHEDSRRHSGCNDRPIYGEEFYEPSVKEVVDDVKLKYSSELTFHGISKIITGSMHCYNRLDSLL